MSDPDTRSFVAGLFAQARTTATPFAGIRRPAPKAAPQATDPEQPRGDEYAQAVRNLFNRN